MRFCTKCGNQLSDEALFCTNCGAQVQPVSAVQPEAVQEKKAEKIKKEKKHGKGKVVAISILALLLIGAAVGGYFAFRWYNSDEQQLLRALKEGQYDQVMDIIDEDSSLKYSDVLAEQLQKRLDTLKADFTAQTVEYSAVQMELDTIAQIGNRDLKGTISEVRTYVDKLNASRTAFATAESFFASENYVEAIAQYKQVIREDSNYETAQTKANEAVTLYRTKVLADAAAYAGTKAYENALTLLEDALKNLPDDAQITQQIQLYEKNLAQKLLTEALNEAEKYANTEDYLSAMAVLNRYILTHGENVDVKLALNGYESLYADMVLANAEEKANAGDYPGAIAVLQTGLADVSGNEKLSVYLGACTDAYVTEVVTIIDRYLADRDYDNAASVVYDALQILPHNEVLWNKQQEVELYEPIPLTDVHIIDKYNYSAGWQTDSFGNQYGTGFALSYGGYVCYNLAGNYSTLVLVVAPGQNSGKCTLQISADGAVIYTVTIEITTVPQVITLDVTNCTVLKVQKSGSGEMIIGDPYLQK